MSYRREIVVAGNRMEIRDYHAAHIGLHKKRQKRERPSPEAVKKAYLREKERKLRWLMNANFRDKEDALVTFSWPKSQRPASAAEVRKEAQLLTRRLRKIYKEHGLICKWIYTMEVGPKGSRHIHMILSNANMLLLLACWPYANIDIKPLWSGGEYGDIAAYFCKYAEKTADTEGEKLGAHTYYASRNLEKPVIIKQTIRESDISKEPPEMDGWILDKGSVQEGVSDLTQRPYRECRYSRDKANIKPLPAKTSAVAKIREVLSGAAQKAQKRLIKLFRRRGGE